MAKSSEKKKLYEYAAIDLGADSGRIILGSVDVRGKKVSYKVIHRFPTKGTYIFNTFRWNVLRFWEEIKKGLKKTIESCETGIRSIAVDSWGVNLVYLMGKQPGPDKDIDKDKDKDKNYVLELACQPFHYRDELSSDGMKTAEKLLDLKKVYSITGIQHVFYNGLQHIAGIFTRYPDILKRTDKIVMIPDYFNYLLTGKLTAEYTNAATTEMFDANKKEWSEEILKPFGLNKSMFPEPLQPGVKIGELHPSVCEELGIEPVEPGHSIPVVTVASHDTGSAVIGIPTLGGNWAYLSSGTWSLLGVEIPEPVLTEKAHEYNLTNEGGAFGTVRFLKNIMGLWLLQRCKEIWDDEYKKRGKELTYEMISKMAMEAPANRTRIIVDSEEFGNPKNMVETIKQHCKKHNQPVPETIGQFTRAIYESLAFRYKEVLDMIEETAGVKVDKLNIVGGGSQDKLLSQITADTLGIDVFCGPIEATAVGNIMMQAYADGIVKDLSEIRDYIRNSFEIIKYTPSKKEYKEKESNITQ